MWRRKGKEDRMGGEEERRRGWERKRGEQKIGREVGIGKGRGGEGKKEKIGFLKDR